MDKEKQRIRQRVEAMGEELLALSHFIHDHPETGLQEYQAVERITALLRAHDVKTKVGLCGLETAFVATVNGNAPGPHVAFFAEYDALPEIGHGCGHNVIAASAVGAFLGLCEQMGSLPGRLSLFGTPGEERGGGKKIMLRHGAFDGLDFVLMIHPSPTKSVIHRPSRSSGRVTVRYLGRSAHSAKPEEGINALSAVLCLFNGIELIRPTFAPGDAINGIVTNGGAAANIIPGEAECKFSLRSNTILGMEKLIERVKCVAEAAATMVGAQAEISVSATPSTERFSNLPMCEAFKANMELLGEHMEYASPVGSFGSSDVNNVSIYIPVIHDYLSISPQGRKSNLHSADFAEDAISSRADEVCINAASGLAMTALDILKNPDLQKNIAEYHQKTVPPEYLHRPK